MRSLRLTILYALFFLAITTVVSAGLPPGEFDSARSYQAAGEYNKAIQYYKIAFRKTTDLDWRWMIFSGVSDCHRQLKQYDEAIKTAQMGLQFALKSTGFPATGPSSLYYKLALAYQGKGQYDKAIDAMGKSIEFRPEYADRYAGMAGILDDKKDYKQARAYWKKAIELDSGKLFGLAHSCYYSGRYDEAIDALNNYIDSLTYGGINCKIKIVNNYSVIDEVLEGGFAKKEGLQAGDKIIKVGSKSTKKQSLEEILNWIKGKEGTKVTLKIMRAGVKKPFTKTLTRGKIVPQTAAESIAFRSLIQRHKGKTEEALKDAELAYSLDSRLFYPILALGASYLDRGQYDQAIKLLSKVHSDNNRLLEAIARLLGATAHAQKHDFEKAINIYSAIPDRDLSPKHVPIWSSRNVLLQTLKPFVVSKKESAGALKAQGRHKEALKELGEAIKIADDAELEAVCSEIAGIMAIDLSLSELPEEARKYALRGDVMTKEGKFEEAAKQYRKALQAAPYIAKLYFNTAMVYGELKKYPQAIRHIKTYLRLAPEAPNARAAKDQIYKWEFMMEGE